MQGTFNLNVSRHDFKQVFDVAANVDAQASQIDWVHMEKTTQGYEKFKSLTGFGFATVRDQGGSSGIDYRRELYDLTITPQVLSIRTIIDEQAMFTDQYAEFKKTAQLLGASVKATRIKAVTDILNNAYTSGYNGADGVILASASHPNNGYPTYSNILAATSLSEYALGSLRSQMSLLGDPRQLVMGSTGNWTLVVPRNLEVTALKIVNSTQVAGNNLNDKNVIEPWFKVRVLDYLTSGSTQWQIVSDNKEHSIYLLDQMPPDVKQTMTPEGHMEYVANSSYATGWMNGYGIGLCAGAA